MQHNSNWLHHVRIGSDNGNVWISPFIIDHTFQKQGVENRAFSLLLTEIKEVHEANKIYLNTELENTVAIALYNYFGFENTGRIVDGELVFVLIIKV